MGETVVAIKMKPKNATVSNLRTGKRLKIDRANTPIHCRYGSSFHIQAHFISVLELFMKYSPVLFEIVYSNIRLFHLSGFLADSEVFPEVKRFYPE